MKAETKSGPNEGPNEAQSPGAEAAQTHRRPLAPGLYLVATPIGNARDITLRALDILKGCDVIYCEDTRVTGKLCALHGIHTALKSYHEHNAERVRPHILDRLSEGAVIALVSDAGTPLVSDPGYRLVKDVVDAGYSVTTAPGASSVLAGLSLAALPTDRFLFAGFLPAKGGPRRRALEEVASAPATLVFLESPRRLAASLGDMVAVLGPREAAIARELTKLHEEIRRGTLDELASHYDEAGPPKGEVVVVVAPPGSKDNEIDESEIDDRLGILLETESVKSAAAQLAEETGLSKRDLYQRALALKSARAQ